MPYESIDMEIKIPEKRKIVFQVDCSIPEKFSRITEINTLISQACIDTYKQHTGRMSVNCLDINTEFLARLASMPNRPAIADYNNLFTPRPGNAKTLFGSHHMVQIEFGGYFIGVDVAAEQFRKDGVVAEVTVAESSDRLNRILMERHGLGEPWLINEIRRSQGLLGALRVERKSKEVALLSSEQGSRFCNIM